MSLGYRALMANLWLTAPLIKAQMEKDQVARALLGTSQAVTMVHGGVKANVLPERACATVNYRLFPWRHARNGAGPHRHGHERPCRAGQFARVRPASRPVGPRLTGRPRA
jgi:acetylornithine deacetylase/succinyl-diaminopimelate desuccinylase-like protein